MHAVSVRLVVACGLLLSVASAWAAPPVSGPAPAPSRLDQILAEENSGSSVQQAGQIDDLAFLRRVQVDLLGQIPTLAEIKEYQSWPTAERRERLVEKLLQDPRYADRWTVFFADLLRIRSNADGGAQLLAYVHQSVKEGLPYDDMARRLISANGKAGRIPEVGFILGDNAQPLALAAVTAQVFMGVRIACAECHDHPFDTWTREQFYGLAAYFGKTRRIESELTRQVFTMETAQTAVLWPPEDKAAGEPRKPMPAKFPFEMMNMEATPEFVARLQDLRARQTAGDKADEGPSLDDLLASADKTAKKATDGAVAETFDVAGEVRKEGQNLKVMDDLYKSSELRQKLASLITSPRNRYFARSLVNRVWKEVVGRGFVEPVDDFSEANPPSHPRSLDYLSEEFVAQGYDLRSLLKTIVLSDVYSRDRLGEVDDATREEAEAAFASAPVRRMLAEAMFDSMVVAGHLFEQKYPEGANIKTISRLERVAIPREGGEAKPATGAGNLAQLGGEPGKGMERMGKPVAMAGAYDLESAVEVDFEALLKEKGEEIKIDQMAVMSAEQLEAMRMQAENSDRQRFRYVERYVDFTFDDNPTFTSSMRMASPADPSHFLRVFGQTDRADLDSKRIEDPSMRQALMMLNGRLTHEAARVGEFEPIYPLVAGKTANLDKAVEMAYLEILTRQPSADEVADAKAVISGAENAREGMADLRWVLLNCHEFRFLP